MERSMRSRLLACILGIVALIISLALGGDVTVKQGSIAGTNLTLSGNASIGGDASISDDLTVTDKMDSMYVGYYSHPYGYFRTLDVWYSVDAGDDIDATQVGYYSRPAGYFDSLQADDELAGTYIYAYKMDSFNGYDPPYVLYDRQSREQVADLVMRAVPPEKQGGAALFFNSDTHKLEVYVPAEGKFYDLQGNLLGSILKQASAAGQYQTAYFLDPQTGQVRSRQKCVSNRYVLKKGYSLDGKTGRFIKHATGEAVSREEALEVYAPSEGKYYDLRGNFVRAKSAEGTVYATEYRLDSQTGQVEARRRPVYGRYVLKKGYALDRETARFINEETGEIVTKEAAVELRQASSAEGTQNVREPAR
jgi:hypothetical protein